MQDFLLVAAHPDDETIGASSCLQNAACIVHVTDGAPRDLLDAARHGFATWKEYAAARQAELGAALQIADVSSPRLRLEVADQAASGSIVEIAGKLRAIVAEIRPSLILTHPYEGGHPDHDACSAAVHLAAGTTPVWEFAGYHNNNGEIRTGEFLQPDVAVHTMLLSKAEQDRKRAMFDCFRTQSEMLQLFGTEVEKFRPAPTYDYTQPPHSGTLLYERFPWGMTGSRFRELAASAFAEWRHIIPRVLS